MGLKRRAFVCCLLQSELKFCAAQDNFECYDGYDEYDEADGGQQNQFLVSLELKESIDVCRALL